MMSMNPNPTDRSADQSLPCSAGAPELTHTDQCDRDGIVLQEALDSEFGKVEPGKMFHCRFQIPEQVRDLKSFLHYRTLVERHINQHLTDLFDAREGSAGVQFKAIWAVNELLPNIFEHSFLGLGKEHKNAIKDDSQLEEYSRAVAVATGNLNDTRFNTRSAEVSAAWQDDGSFLLTVKDTGGWRGFNREARAEIEAFDRGENLEVHGQNGLGVLLAFAPDAHQDPETGLISVPLKNESTT